MPPRKSGLNKGLWMIMMVKISFNKAGYFLQILGRRFGIGKYLFLFGAASLLPHTKSSLWNFCVLSQVVVFDARFESAKSCC